MAEKPQSGSRLRIGGVIEITSRHGLKNAKGSLHFIFKISNQKPCHNLEFIRTHRVLRIVFDFVRSNCHWTNHAVIRGPRLIMNDQCNMRCRFYALADCSSPRRTDSGWVRLCPPAFQISLHPKAAGALRAPQSKQTYYFCRPKTSRNATFRSSSARAQSPMKLDPCIMARVFGFRSASFFRFCAVSGVYGTYSAGTPTHALVTRLVSVDKTGGKPLLCKYTFHHTRTLPGPGEW